MTNERVGRISEMSSLVIKRIIGMNMAYSAAAATAAAATAAMPVVLGGASTT